MRLWASSLFLTTILLMVSCQETEIIEKKPDSTSLAPPVSGYFKKNVLIEDYTGTWCGNCTRVAWAIEETKEASDKVVSVAIHNGNDPYHFAGIDPLKNLILPSSALALPVSRLNRMTIWSFPETSNIQQAIDLTSNNTTLGLAMSSTVADGQIDLEVRARFLEDYSNLKLVVYLLEDHLLYNQRNYITELYGGLPVVPNFEHNHVLRASLTNILGESLEGSNRNTTVTRNFNIPVPSNIANADNISFVAFVTDINNNALNARAADANENQTFQENP
ncbi:MAG: Omp28-related outer membrane protein [Bacteroidetes bacterium]|nr:Omp28-related outer membrane protein [Bacteroidota bacterium]